MTSGEKKPPPRLTRKDIQLAWCAMADAISDREAFVEAYTFPSYAKPDAEAQRIRRESVAQVRKYKQLQAKLSKVLQAMTTEPVSE